MLIWREKEDIIRKIILVMLIAFLPLMLLIFFHGKTAIQASADFVPTATLAWQKPVDSWPHASQIADLNNDGKQEVVFSTDKSLYIFSADSGNLIKRIPISSYDAFTPPVLINMDADPDLEIVSENGRYISAWNMDGTVVPGWPKDSGQIYASSVMAGDVDSDGAIDIVGLSYDYRGVTTVSVWDKKGTLLRGWPRTFNNFWPGIPALADLDGDRNLEIVLPVRVLSNQEANGAIKVLKSDGTNMVGWPRAYTRDVNVVSVASVNHDANLKIFAGTGYALDFGGNRVLGYNSDGTSMGWTKSTEYNLNELSIGDMNNDGYPEFAIDDAAGGGGTAKLFTNKGQDVFNWPISISQKQDALEAPILADINNDGKADFISALTSGTVFAASYSGALIPLNINISPLMSISLQAGDFNNDGRMEIFLEGNSFQTGVAPKVFMYNLNSRYSPSSMQWPSERHDLRNTGLFNYIPRSSTQSDEQFAPDDSMPNSSGLDSVGEASRAAGQ